MLLFLLEMLLKRVGWLSKLFVAVCICALLPPGHPSPSLETTWLFSPTVPKIIHTPGLLIACLKRWSHWWLSFIKSPAGLKVPLHCYGTNLDSCHSNPPVLNRFHVIDSATYLALIRTKPHGIQSGTAWGCDGSVCRVVWVSKVFVISESALYRRHWLCWGSQCFMFLTTYEPQVYISYISYIRSAACPNYLQGSPCEPEDVEHKSVFLRCTVSSHMLLF